MKKWFKKFIVPILVWSSGGKNSSAPSHREVVESLDDFADEQIAYLCLATREYVKAKKNPDAFVEKYFSSKITPVRPFVDSWVKDVEQRDLTLDFNWNVKNRGRS